MRLLSEQLSEAVQDGTERVRLMVGQFVEVRTHGGDLVITGTIQQMFNDIGVIRVADMGSGSDVQIDVDPKEYEIWVIDMPVPGNAPTPSKQPEVNFKGSNPGVATLGKANRVFQNGR